MLAPVHLPAPPKGKRNVAAPKKRRSNRKNDLRAGDRTETSGNEKYTPEKVKAFLVTLADTAQVAKAAQTIGMTRMGVYNWRKKYPEFAAQWDEAVAIGMTRLEDEGVRRGADGWKEAVYHQGEVVGHVTKYSDTLLTFMLSAHNSKYGKQRVEATGKDGAPLHPTNIRVTFVAPDAVKRKAKT
jgi:hypothetical protein